ncbi:MAG: hypothetical protein KBT20_10575 [Bacteroidales bacterium]|nr:hypothetical protein [Candidatus Liminaster caballi]
MKTIVKGLFLLLAFVFTGCASLPTEQRTGKDDVASLQFVTQGKYTHQKVYVDLDGTTFEANPVKAKKARLKGKLYSVATGKRKIVVKDSKGNTIFNKYIMLYSQETQQITLP